jgi:hypothetical protein
VGKENDSKTFLSHEECLMGQIQHFFLHSFSILEYPVLNALKKTLHFPRSPYTIFLVSNLYFEEGDILILGLNALHRLQTVLVSCIRCGIVYPKGNVVVYYKSKARAKESI